MNAYQSTYDQIKPFIRVTPVIEIDGADFELPGVKLVFKLELLQYSGSFKARGAFANLLIRKPAAGVVAASGGNHGAAVAYAAGRLGVPAKIFVPETAPEAKRELIREYGAELVVGGKTYDEAKKASEQVPDAMPIHAYNQEETLLGAGSTGLELLQQAPDIDTLLVSVGGGGLIGGITAALAGSHVRVIGVEPRLCPALHDALRAGKPVDAPVGGIAKDSLGAKRVGELMFPIVRDADTTVVLVSDDDIREAQRKLWKRLHILAEPGAATAFAALLSRRYVPRHGEKIAILICGGNTDAVDFTRQEK